MSEHQPEAGTDEGIAIQSLSGEAVPVFDEFTTVMYLEPRDIRTTIGEARERGYVPIGDWLGVGPADVDFGSQDLIVWNGRTFDVVSPPRVMPNPCASRISISSCRMSGLRFGPPARAMRHDCLSCARGESWKTGG